ncbi:Putative Cell wall mannoprotein [Septoria linicola]|uniref:Cell wall mannoprotein n=1 Tax=Septoria linicola TaxID=215465 RepID=A0A9Q9AWN8_9PEZI|nr:putative Cell wall mannoprotein [Septoria linicola]USW54548.1 Putative Cell wall mannoprotein [Septoria linicola]
MLRLSKFAQLAASAKNAMSSRSAASTQENLNTINASVQKLIGVVNAYGGGLLAASPISNQEAALGIDIKNATADANASEVVTVDEAKDIIGYITNTLAPSIRDCMAAMKSKKELFVSSSLQGTVTGDMKDLRVQTETLGKALVAKAPASEQEEGRRVLKVIDADFEDAIKHFS